MYASYEDYTDGYHGNMASPEEFSRLSVKAAAFLDSITFGRARAASLVQDGVKFAACAVVDAMLLNEQGGGLVSETVGRVTRNYAAGVNNSGTDISRLYNAVTPFLLETGLLYAGVDL